MNNSTDMASAIWGEPADLRRLLDDAIRREAKLAADLEQTRLYIQDALLVDDEDIGVVKDILHGALDVGQ